MFLDLILANATLGKFIYCQEVYNGLLIYIYIYMYLYRCSARMEIASQIFDACCSEELMWPMTRIETHVKSPPVVCHSKGGDMNVCVRQLIHAWRTSQLKAYS